jgi:hypothetical protein
VPKAAKSGKPTTASVHRCGEGPGGLGYGVESVRAWVHRADIHEGVTAGTTTADPEKIKELEQEVKELRRANSILRSASAFFAAELDRPSVIARLHRRPQEGVRDRADARSCSSPPPPATHQTRSTVAPGDPRRRVEGGDRVVHQANDEVYGVRKLWKRCADIGRDPVARLMRELGIEGVNGARLKHRL